jgi:hypothetical protein
MDLHERLDRAARVGGDLGDRVDSGRLSEAAFSQLIQSTGLTPQ